jgi:hypothetical protein
MSDLTEAKRIAEVKSKTQDMPCEIYSLIAVCHPPEPQLCRWEEFSTNSTPRPLQVGDKVKIKALGKFAPSLPIGMIGKIVEINSDEVVIDFRGNGSCQICSHKDTEEFLELVKSDRDYDLVPLPKGFAPPPDGFAYAGLGPIKNLCNYAVSGISGAINGRIWSHPSEKGNGQTLGRHYALRIGSEIAKQNGIGGEV